MNIHHTNGNGKRFHETNGRIEVPHEPTAATNGKVKDFSRVFQFFGVALGKPNGSGEVEGECPFCDKDRFHVNVSTGQYHCKHCSEEGNVTTFLTWMHKASLEITTPEQYSQLGKLRGIKPQTLERHGIAYVPSLECWLFPFKNAKGNIVNLQLYYPERDKPNKHNLPDLPTALYGFDKLVNTKSKDKRVLLCEGVPDALALDYSIGPENRPKYVIVATPGSFKEEWVPYFEGRKVSAFYHRDKGGEQHRDRVRTLLGESGVAAEVKLLRWPNDTPEGVKDINDLIRLPDFKNKSVLGWLQEHSGKITAQPKLLIYHGRRPLGKDRPPEWICEHRLPCRSYVSFSGKGGTFKTTIACEIAARYSTGKSMLMSDKASMPPGHVLYIFIEDDRSKIEDAFERADGDFTKWHPMPAKTVDGEIVNVLEHLREIKETIREFGIRLVVLDGQNSLVGAPNISTDMLARINVSNKLHTFAQEMDLCLLGIRNEDNEGRAMGPQSFGDIGRAVIRAVEVEPKTDPPYCKLMFEKVNDTARANHPPIPYSAKDHGGSHAEILWGKEAPPTTKFDEADLKNKLLKRK